MRSFSFANPGYVAGLNSDQPAPGAVLRIQPLLSSKRRYRLPGLSACEVITVFMVLNKAPSAEGLHMLFSILTAGSGSRTWFGYTGRSYTHWLGLTYNTYVDGFLYADQTQTVLDDEKQILLTVELGHAGAVFYLNGVKQTMLSVRNAQTRLPWSDEIVVGGETDNPGYDWLGLIADGFVYPSQLPIVDRLQTESYLRTLYPKVK